MKLELGTKFFYPRYGVVEVIRLDVRPAGSKVKQVALLRVLNNDVTLVMATDAFEDLGCREALTREQLLETLIAVMKVKPDVTYSTWNRRYREYMEALGTCTLVAAASVYRNLHYLRLEQDLSYGERNMFDQALRLILAEAKVAGVHVTEVMSIMSREIE